MIRRNGNSIINGAAVFLMLVSMLAGLDAAVAAQDRKYSHSAST